MNQEHKGNSGPVGGRNGGTGSPERGGGTRAVLLLSFLASMYFLGSWTSKSAPGVCGCHPTPPQVTSAASPGVWVLGRRDRLS